FFQDSKIRVADVTDGTSNTFLFGERSHRDPEFDRITQTSFPDFYPMGKYGMWAAAFATSGGSLRAFGKNETVARWLHLGELERGLQNLRRTRHDPPCYRCPVAAHPAPAAAPAPAPFPLPRSQTPGLPQD